MKVTGPGASRGVGPADRKKKADSSGSSDFAEHLQDAAEPAAAGSSYGAGAVSSVNAVLAAQEVPDATQERARNLVRRRGENLLDRLERIRIQLLSGRLSKDELAQLAHALREKRPQVSDPMLIEIMDEIELRVQVEIAKYTRTS
ncbi:flagellar assembly protein FliX [Magnetospira sp. QH-2]|uniref:flagellar assembly protein FliX n=1 Tax=Magnetospira sp. (strain QH-2) TaxID=1288970 RepID=UPI0005F9E22D|nr:flagellar assembly protein FliX [Magnetospira sp. QH-2]